MAKCIIVGGGLAGLSAAVYLAKAGHQIELIEATPKLGGRTYSFYDNEINAEIDNGQHILIGAYSHTLKLLNLIKANHLLNYQDNLRIIFRQKNNITYKLDASKFLYPFNLLDAIWNYEALTRKEKINFIKFVLSLYFTNPKKIEKLTIREWLMANGQSENSIKSFWEILGVGALNTNLDEASAALFCKMLKKIFFNGNSASTIIIPSVGLSKLFIEPTLEYLQNYNFSFSVSEKLEKIIIGSDKGIEISTNKRRITDFDYLILAIPLLQLRKIECSIPLNNFPLKSLESSSIVTIHLILKNNLFSEKFYALIDSPIQWVFNHGKYLSIVISAANDLNDQSSEEITKLCLEELELYFIDFDRKAILKSKVIKEKRATLKSTPEFEFYRKEFNYQIDNIYFACDYTNTGLPQTIESAVESGFIISQKIK